MAFCKICGKEFKALTLGHLKKHGTNLEDYQKNYVICEKQTNTGRTHFKYGHVPSNKGNPRSYETKKKISESLKGRKVWNTGKRLSEQHRQRLSSAHKGKYMSEEVKKKISETLMGKRLTEERKKKISQSLKGRKLSNEWLKKISKTWFKKNHSPWNLGKEHSEETKRKISQSLKGGKWVTEGYRMKMRDITKRKWEDEEFVEKVLRGMSESTKIKPNLIEQKMIKLIKDNNLHFNYVGDGNFWIRNKETSYNPDFLHENKRKIIEVFGDYWHNKESHKKRDIERIKVYKEKGFDVLIIWENQIKKSQEEVIKQVRNFLENGP